MFFSDLESLNSDNFHNLMPYLEAANAAVEDISYHRTDYFNSIDYKQTWSNFLQGNKTLFYKALKNHCMSVYFAFLLRFVRHVLGQTISIENILTPEGLNFLKSAPFKSIQLPFHWESLKTRNWYYSNGIQNSEEQRFQNWSKIKLTSLLYFEQKFETKESLVCDWSVLKSVLNFLYLVKLRHVRTFVSKQTTSNLTLIEIEPKQSNELLFLVFYLMEVKLLLEGNEHWEELNANFEWLDRLDFRNILLRINGWQNSMQYSGQLMISILEIGKRKKLFKQKLVESKFLEQRFQMWKLSIPAKHQNDKLSHSGFFFVQVISLPYKGVSRLDASVYDPTNYYLQDIKQYNWQEMEKFQAHLDKWSENYLCDAEVRYVLIRRLAYLLLWLLSTKDENGNVIDFKNDGILFDYHLTFPLEKST